MGSQEICPGATIQDQDLVRGSLEVGVQLLRGEGGRVGGWGEGGGRGATCSGCCCVDTVYSIVYLHPETVVSPVSFPNHKSMSVWSPDVED